MVVWNLKKPFWMPTPATKIGFHGITSHLHPFHLVLRWMPNWLSTSNEITCIWWIGWGNDASRASFSCLIVSISSIYPRIACGLIRSIYVEQQRHYASSKQALGCFQPSKPVLPCTFLFCVCGHVRSAQLPFGHEDLARTQTSAAAGKTDQGERNRLTSHPPGRVLSPSFCVRGWPTRLRESFLPLLEVGFRSPEGVLEVEGGRWEPRLQLPWPQLA